MPADFFNIIIAVLSLVYVFGVVFIMDKFVKKGFPQDISRKIIHIAAGSWLFFWLFYDNSTWTKYLNILPGLVWFVLLIIKGFWADENDEAVKTMTRTGNKKELLKGPLYFTIIMSFLGTFFYRQEIAVISMGILGWGDGLAPIIGKKFGTIKYKVFVEKSLQGSISFFIFGFLGAVLLLSVLHMKIDLSLILLCCVITTIIEAISPKDLDNLLIPIVCILIYFLT
ncbi:MAG: phosphatidate cytidylyltransferase [bacterium]